MALKNYRFFAWFTGWSSFGYACTIGNFGGSVLVTGFDWGVIFILVPSWLIYWSLFWPTSLTGTLGGTARGLLFWIYCLGSSMLPCVHAIILLKGLQVMHSIVNRRYLVWRDKFHPWKISVAYEMFWKKIILCLIFVLLLSWGCMICDTCSVPLLVMCTSHLIHVAPTMHDHLVCYA